MRIVKKAEERKNEILDAADALFNTKGYDGTSTNDILDKVGIARGTLYHHFKSKEDIMDALIERYSIQFLAEARKIAVDSNIPVMERIIEVIKALNFNDHDNGKEMLNHIHRPQNALMNKKMDKMILTNVTPILTGIVEEGIELGVFKTPYPYETVEMIVVYVNTVFDHEMEVSEEEMMRRIQAFICNIEKVLGIKEGDFIPYMMKAFS
ncbi:MAG: TetR/AcrR family transcriptional regulator [Coprobacillaceae bacterium]